MGRGLLSGKQVLPFRETGAGWLHGLPASLGWNQGTQAAEIQSLLLLLLVTQLPGDQNGLLFCACGKRRLSIREQDLPWAQCLEAKALPASREAWTLVMHE